MELNEFRGRVQDALIAIHEARTASAPAELQTGPSDWREVLSIVRSAAEELILCASVNEAIDRLKQDQSRLILVDWVASFERSDAENRISNTARTRKRDSRHTRAAMFRLLLLFNRDMQRVRTRQTA